MQENSVLRPPRLWEPLSSGPDGGFGETQGAEVSRIRFWASKTITLTRTPKRNIIVKLWTSGFGGFPG